MVNDTRGHVSELLAKSINKGALDQDVTAEDKERMLAFLREYGDLTPDYLFKGTERSGFKVPPGAGKEDPVAIDPLPMDVLLDARLWQGLMSEDAIDWQATMFQPVGGMDHIPAAFAKHLGEVVRYQAVVKKIRHDSSGAHSDLPRCEDREDRNGQGPILHLQHPSARASRRRCRFLSRCSKDH